MQIKVRRGVIGAKLHMMGVLMIVLICGVIGMCQQSLGGENTTRTSYSERYGTRNSGYNGTGQKGSQSYGNSNYNPGTNRPPSRINYLELIDFEDPSGMKWALDCT